MNEQLKTEHTWSYRTSDSTFNIAGRLRGRGRGVEGRILWNL